MAQYPLSLFLILVFASLSSAQEYASRSWTAKNGKTIDATFTGFEGKLALLQSTERGQIKVPVTSFGADDQAWLKKVVAAQKEAAGLTTPELGRARAAQKALERLDEIGRVETDRAFMNWYQRDFEPFAENPPALGKNKPDLKAATAFFKLQKEALANAKAINDARKGEAKIFYDQLEQQYQSILDGMVDTSELDTALKNLADFLERAIEMAPDAYLRLRPKAEALQEKLTELRDTGRPEPLSYVASKRPSFASDAFHWWYTKEHNLRAKHAASEHGFGEGEIENADLVNHYRVLLGLEPLHFNKALCLAARGHSQEMVELEYFSHSSPTAGRKTFIDRAKREGYNGPSAENIASGAGSGEKAFWMWFMSPGHHKGMIADHKDIGVGRYGNHWTQVFGRGE